MTNHSIHSFRLDHNRIHRCKEVEAVVEEEVEAVVVVGSLGNCIRERKYKPHHSKFLSLDSQHHNHTVDLHSLHNSYHLDNKNPMQNNRRIQADKEDKEDKSRRYKVLHIHRYSKSLGKYSDYCLEKFHRKRSHKYCYHQSIVHLTEDIAILLLVSKRCH